MLYDATAPRSSRSDVLREGEGREPVSLYPQYPRAAQREKNRPPHTMSDDELIEVLEEIVRDEAAPATARVTAIRTLWEWRRNEPDEEPTGFDDLYADEFTRRREHKKRR